MSSSLGKRANRIVNKQEPEAKTPQARPAGTRKSPGDPWDDSRLARWKVLVTKLCWVIRVYAIKNAAKLLLGNQNYLRIFGAIRRSAETSEISQPESRLLSFLLFTLLNSLVRLA